MSHDEGKRRLDIKSIKGTYNVRIDNKLMKRDKNRCIVSSMCMLTNSEVLLADQWNHRLKKLNSSYKVISHCGVPEDPYFVCYIGNDTAVGGLSNNTIQYVNVSGNINLMKLVRLDHDCLALACHGDTLYVNSGDTIYKYDKDCKKKHALYNYKKNLDMSYRASIAISDNGDRLYFRNDTDLSTIDATGNLKSSSHFDEYDISDILIACEGIVLALDVTNNLHQLDYDGKKRRTVDSIPLDNLYWRSMCFDRERCRLIVGGSVDKIHVYECEISPS